MNKGSNSHYTLLLQDETETDGVGMEEEEEIEDGLNGIEEEEEEEEEEDDEPIEDSEEEIFSSSKHRTLSHHEGANLNGQNHLVSPSSEYRLLNNNDSDLKTALDTPITIWTPTPMSPARRACFIASIMLGVLVVATFLWVLPCDVQPCEGDVALRDREWAVKIEGMGINETRLVQRLGGGSNVVLSYYISSNVSAWDANSSLLADGDQWHLDHSQTDCINCGAKSEEYCGLLMLDGNLGRENWRIPLRECPVDLQCDLLDVSGDRFPDCIIRGPYSMLFMVEVRYGTTMWHLHMHNKDTDMSPGMSEGSSSAKESSLKLLHPSPALLLPDINNDNYADLLFSGHLTSDSTYTPWNDHTNSEASWNINGEFPEPASIESTTNHLVLVCGQSGSILGAPMVLKQCRRILSIALKEDHWIEYSCISSNNERHAGKILLSALLNQILRDEAPTEKLDTSQKSIESNGRSECEVRVTSQGVCPRCHTQVQLRSSENKVVWESDYEHSAVVAWAPLWSHKKCHGAVLKVWEWRHTTNIEKTAKPPPGNRRTTRSSLVSEEADSAETEATYLENNQETEINVDSVPYEGNNASKYDDGSIKYNELLKIQSKSDQGNRNEGTTNSVQDNLALQPPTTIESPRARRDFAHNSAKYTYDHSNAHRHHSKQVASSQEDHISHPEAVSHSEGFHLQESKELKFSDHIGDHHQSKKVVTTTVLPASFPTGSRILHQNVLAPLGYQLQQIHERLALLRNNGTAWHEETLTSLGLGITQLCKSEDACLPSVESHARSVEVTHGVKMREWQVVSSSTTYVNTPLHGGEQHHTSPWSLTSIVRKILVFI